MKCLTLNALNQDAELIAGIKAPQITSSQAPNRKILGSTLEPADPFC